MFTGWDLSRLLRRKDRNTESDHQPTAEPQTTTDTQLNTAHTPTEGTTTMTNNREIALQHAASTARPGATPEQIQAAASTYLDFLEGRSSGTGASAPAAPAPRFGAEIIDALRRLTLPAVVKEDVLRRAEQLRRSPLEEAKRTALDFLRRSGVDAYGSFTVGVLTAAVQNAGTGAVRPTPAATTGQAVIDLLSGYRGRYGHHIDDLIEAAQRRGFAGLPLATAKSTAITELERYTRSYPSEARGLINAIRAL